MKLLLFTNTFFPTIGGAEFVVHHLASELSRRGHEVCVLAPRPEGLHNGITINYKLSRYRRPLSKRFGLRQLLLPLLMRKFQEGFDLLHCHNAYPPGYVAATFKKFFPQVPVVITCHGTDIMASERLRQNQRIDRRLCYGVQSADIVTAISTSMQAEILSAGVEASKIRLIHNGVDLAAFQQAGEYEYPRPFIFSMGGLRRRKGFDILLRAMQIVVSKNTELDLLLAGDGIEAENLHALHSELQLGERVRFLGNVHAKEKVALYQACEFFVCPSRWEEPFGMINIEAMAAGGICIASRVGGIRDVIDDAVNGVLVDKEDPEVLAAAILELHAEPAKRKEMAVQALKKVQQFNWSLIVDQYEAVYQEQLAKSYV